MSADFEAYADKFGFDIQIASATERSGIGTFVCWAIFKHSELLEATGEAANAYVEYLSMVRYLEKSGIEIERETNSFDGIQTRHFISCFSSYYSK